MVNYLPTNLHFITRTCFFILFSFSFFTCSSLKTNDGKGTIEGLVSSVEGNQMQSEGMGAKNYSIKRDIFIYELTNIKDVFVSGRFITSISSDQVVHIKSNKQGKFKVNLKEGVYSILVKEKQGYFVSEYDSKNNLHPIVVKAGEKTSVSININYNAYY